MDLLKSMSRELNEGGTDGDHNIIDENIWGITYNDEQEPVTLAIWFMGDKRDGVREVFWKCENPPSDIDNNDAILDLIWEKTGLSSHTFKGATFIRINDEKQEDEVRTVLSKLTTEDLDDLQLILSLAKVMAERLEESKNKPRYAAIDRWQSRAIQAKVRQQLKAIA